MCTVQIVIPIIQVLFKIFLPLKKKFSLKAPPSSTIQIEIIITTLQPPWPLPLRLLQQIVQILILTIQVLFTIPLHLKKKVNIKTPP